MPRTGGQVIVDYLVRQGVPYLVGVCGHGILGLLDAAYDRRDDIETITVHDERVAGFMADAYFRITGSPLATYTSCGPGSVNIVMAIAGAFQDSSAILAVTGNVPTQQFNRGPFQESGRHFQGDFASVIRPYVKRSFQAARTDMLPAILPQAFGLMLTGRAGPVNIDVPLNVFAEPVGDGEPEPYPFARDRIERPAPSPNALDAAAALLLDAKRPVVLAGNGAQAPAAREWLRHLVDHLRVPLITTPLGKGALAETHELSLGPIGRNGTFAANNAARKADVLLALGTRFDDRATSSWMPGVTFGIPPTALIHVDIDAQEIGRNYPPTLGVIADTTEFLRGLMGTDAVRSAEPSSARRVWETSVRGWKQQWSRDIDIAAADSAVPVKPSRFVRELQLALPAHAVLLADVGVHHNWLLQQLVVPEGVRFLQAWGFAAMGFGVAGVLGAHLAAPDRPAITICGDGGFVMHANAVLTAVEYGWPATWIVWNNSGYGAIDGQQQQFFGAGREIATRFRRAADGQLASPDCAAIGASMGALGLRVDKPSDIGPAITEALASGRPAVIDVVVDDAQKAPATGSWSLPPFAGPAPDYV